MIAAHVRTTPTEEHLTGQRVNSVDSTRATNFRIWNPLKKCYLFYSSLYGNNHYLQRLSATKVFQISTRTSWPLTPRTFETQGSSFKSPHQNLPESFVRIFSFPKPQQPFNLLWCFQTKKIQVVLIFLSHFPFFQFSCFETCLEFLSQTI